MKIMKSAGLMAWRLVTGAALLLLILTVIIFAAAAHMDAPP